MELAFVVVMDRPGAVRRVAALLTAVGATVEVSHSRGWLVRMSPDATKTVASHPDVVVAGGVQVPALRRIRKVVATA